MTNPQVVDLHDGGTLVAADTAALLPSAASAGAQVRSAAEQVDRFMTDSGPGFDPGALVVRPDGGQGLAGLRDRAESIGGEVEIESAVGQGTVLRLRLPLEGGQK